nr:unnamed protein product [Callosobruchus analis]
MSSSDSGEVDSFFDKYQEWKAQLNTNRRLMYAQSAEDLAYININDNAERVAAAELVHNRRAKMFYNKIKEV